MVLVPERRNGAWADAGPGSRTDREMPSDHVDDEVEDEPGWLNRQQGYFGEKLIAALAAAAGLSVSTPELDLGFDLNLESAGDIVRLQVKSSRTPLTVADDNLRYDLDVEAYNRLRTEYTVATYLVVVQVPDTRSEWVSCASDDIAIRRCAHYASLLGQPPTENANSITVSLPLVNMVTPTTLRAMVKGGLE